MRKFLNNKDGISSVDNLFTLRLAEIRKKNTLVILLSNNTSKHLNSNFSNMFINWYS